MIASCCTSRTQLGWAKRTATANWRRACGEKTAHSANSSRNTIPVLKDHRTRQLDKVGGYFPGVFRRRGNLRKMSMDDQSSKCITRVEGIFGPT